MPHDPKSSNPAKSLAAIECPAFGGRVSVHDPDGYREELAAAMIDVGNLIQRLGRLRVPPAGVECPAEVRRFARVANDARQYAARAALVLALGFPEEVAEVAAECRAMPPVECGPVAGVVPFPGAA